MSQLGCPKCHVRPVAVGSTKACDGCYEKLKAEVIEIALEIEESKRAVPATDRIRSALDAIDLELAPHLEARASLEGELETALAAEHAKSEAGMREAAEKAKLEAEERRQAEEEQRKADEVTAKKAALEAEAARIEAEIEAERVRVEADRIAIEAERMRLEAEVKAELASEVAELEAAERAKLAAEIADEEAAIALAAVNDPPLTVS